MNNINILWLTENKITVEYFINMYAINSIKNDWWDNVTIIIWGSSNILIKEDNEVQCIIREMLDIGVKVQACSICSDDLGTSHLLKELGVEVKYMGASLTKYLKSSDKTITI